MDGYPHVDNNRKNHRTYFKWFSLILKGLWHTLLIAYLI